MKSIFISSTFRDMQAERDLLHRVVFPGLRRRLAEQGEDIQELDLRWGVDTSDLSEESSNIMVMKTCIDAIDRCLPYMVIFLGDRYGWIPEQKMVENVHDRRLEAWAGEAISITQMEILYGALRNVGQLEKCIFCFRDNHFTEKIHGKDRKDYEAESEVHREKQETLKEKIRQTPGVRILEYSPIWDETAHRIGGLDELAERLSERLWEMIREENEQEKGAPRAERILKNAQLTADRYLTSYVARERLEEFASNFKRRHYGVFLVGEGGSGKSAAGTRITAYYERRGDHAFRYYCGNEGCSDIDTFLDVLLYWEAKDRGRETQDYGNRNTDEKLFLLYRRLGEKPAYDRVFFIDGADQMPAGFLKIVHCLGAAMSNQYGRRVLLVTSTPEPVQYLREAYERADEKETEVFDFFDIDRVSPIGEKEIRSIADRHAALRGKQLDTGVLEQICTHPLSANPYALTMILQRLFMMDQNDFAGADRLAPGMEGLSLYMRQIVRELPGEQSELTACVVGNAAKQLAGYGGSFSQKNRRLADAQEVLSLLAASREGLSLEELNRILEMENAFFPPLLLEQLFCYLYDCFGEEESGRWNFRHRFLRESLLRFADRAVREDGYRKLLHYYQADLKQPGEEFYYLWRVGDVSAAAALLDRQAGQQPDTVLSTVFFRMLRETEESGDGFVESLYPKLTQAALETVNRILLNSEGELFSHVRVLRDFYREQGIGEEGTPLQRLLYLLTALTLEELEIEISDESRALWKRIVRIFSGCDRMESWILRKIYERMIFLAFFGDIVFFDRESREICEKLAGMLKDAGIPDAAEGVRRLRVWGELRSRWIQEKDRSEQEKKALEDCEAAVREWKESGDPVVYHLALYRIAGSRLNDRNYAAASSLYREVIQWAEEGWRGVRSPGYGRLRMLAEADLAGCLKQEYKSGHYVRAWKTAEELAAQFPSPYTHYYLAALCDVLYYCEKQKPTETGMDRIEKWERIGDYLTEGLDAVCCVTRYVRPEEIPVCLQERKLMLLEDRVEWRQQVGSWTARPCMKEDFESLFGGYEELFSRTEDTRYRQSQLRCIVSALDYYGRWREGEGVKLWTERLHAAMGTDESPVNESRRYQQFLCRLSAAESMLRCRNVRESAALLEACREDSARLQGWAGLEKRQDAWEYDQIRLLLLEAEIAEMRGEAVSVWLPASQQAYRRAEELCDRTIRQIPDGKEKGKAVGSVRRNDAVTAQFGLWLRAAQLQADGYRELGDTEQEDRCLSGVKAADAVLIEPGKSARVSLQELGEKGIWLLLEYVRLAMRREKARPCEEKLLPEVLPTDAWERLRLLTEDRRTPHLYWALNDLSIIGKNHIPDCDLRLWPEMYSLTLELMRMYEKPGYDGSQKQRLGILLLRTLWEQAGSGQATDEEKRMLAYTLVNSYRDDDVGYDIPLTTYTSKRYDHKKKMKDMKKIPGPFPWPDSFLCNREWFENVFRYAQQYGRPADRCLAGMRLAVCVGLHGDYEKAGELCCNSEDEGVGGPLTALCCCWRILWKLMAESAGELPDSGSCREAWAQARRIREEQRQWMVKEHITFDMAMDMILYVTGVRLQCEISRAGLQKFLENIREKPGCYWLEQKYSIPVAVPLLHVLADRLVEMDQAEADRSEGTDAFPDRLEDLRQALFLQRSMWRKETEENTGLNAWQRAGEVYRCGLRISDVVKRTGDERQSVKERLNSLWWHYDALTAVIKEGSSADILTEDILGLLPEYRTLSRIRSESDVNEWKDRYGMRSNWVDFNTVMEKMFLFLYERENDSQWLWQLLAEHKEQQRCIREKCEAKDAWGMEWITYSYTDIRQVWLKLAVHLPEEEWAKSYLETVTAQVRHISENRVMLAPLIGKISNALNMELRGIKAESPALQTELRTMIAAMPKLLSGAGYDLSYIMMKAVEVLGAGASDEQVRNYVQENL
ncbi:MAG: DUF4062 domain-containing protein [Clostridiales bacterium]|nr:DUF4062 domain-containing protein [Clostridiales bacterium]